MIDQKQLRVKLTPKNSVIVLLTQFWNLIDSGYIDKIHEVC